MTNEAWVLAGAVVTGLLTLAGVVFANSRPTTAVTALTQTVTTLSLEVDRQRKEIAQMRLDLATVEKEYAEYKNRTEKEIAELYEQLGRARMKPV